MKLERPRPAVVCLTAHATEIATLISAARWVVEGCPGQLPDAAVKQLRQVLANYDRALTTPTG